jgi:hypothetical protein
MEVNSFEQLVKVIINSDEESAAKLIRSYGNQREEKGINDAWDRSRIVLRRALKGRTDRLKKSILNYNEFTANIEVPEFLLYLSAIDEELRYQMEHAPDEGKHVAETIHDLLFNKLGNVKVDYRRIIPLRGED